MLDVEALRKAAEAATPGPWRDFGDEFRYVDSGPDSNLIANGSMSHSDAAFIAAANPTDVLALLDRLEAAEAAVERVRALAVEFAAIASDLDRTAADNGKHNPATVAKANTYDTAAKVLTAALAGGAIGGEGRA